MTESIKGICPRCSKQAMFRELTLKENFSGLFSFVGGAITGDLRGKANAAGTLIEEFNEDRRFPNYKCTSCNGEVMQCSNCHEIIPYADSAAAHACNLNPQSSSQDGNAERSAQTSAEDALSLIEKLASLHKKDLLTDQEFSEKKAELLKRI